MDSDDFFDQGGDRPEVVAGRYRLPHPETGREQSWTRATTHAELPEDSFALTRWQLRQLLLGLRRRPDLLRLIESWPNEPGRDELDAVITTAHEVAGNDAKANLGIAVHGVLQQVDRAWLTDDSGRPVAAGDLAASTGWLAGLEIPGWADPHVRGYLAELDRQGLRPIPTMTERRVVNLDLGCAGTIDNLYEEADGTIALGDKKTGRLDYPERKYAIQLAVYHGSAYLLDPDGGPPIDLRSLGLRREYAVLVYVDPESGACSIYRVDMRRGQLGANLGSQVREWRGERHLLLPYVAPGALPVEAWRAAERAEGERHLTVVGKPRQLPGEPPSEWLDPGTHAVAAGLADDPGNEHSANSTTASLGDVLTWTEDALMKLSKAELQRVLREKDPGASVAHQRKILADKILTLQAGGAVATSSPKSHQATKSADPGELPAGPIGGAEDPTDPRSTAFHRARLAEIGAAESAGALGRIHAYVTRVGGDQAWTDELTEAARARLAQLDAVKVRTIDWRGDSTAPLDAIRLATGSQEMAQVWSLVTVGGSDEAAWTAELNEAAHARLAAIQAAAEGGTPFGPVT